MNTSVIVPFYKGNQYMPSLISCLEKVLPDHSFENHEVLIVNDSPGVEVELPSTDLNVRVISPEKNGGIHKARVIGLREAKGKYVLMLDQDDLTSPDFIRIAEEALDREGADVYLANGFMEHEDGSRTLLYSNKRQLNMVSHLSASVMGHNRIKSPGQALIRKSSIPQVWMDNILTNNGSDDLLLWILMFENKAKFIYDERPYYVHCWTGNNLSDDELKMTSSSFEAAKILEKADYVKPSTIRNLKKARQFALDWQNAGLGKKLLLFFNNLDVLSIRVYWKLYGL